jgi:hypothetical protein
MTKAVPHPKFVITLPQPDCEPQIKNEEDQSHTAACMHSAFT